jgi:hypothetical protein
MKEVPQVFVVVNIPKNAELVELFANVFDFVVSYALLCHLKGLADGLVLGVQDAVEVFRKLNGGLVQDFLALMDTDYMLCTSPQKSFASVLGMT